ncbi:MAG: c-type cytochrome domain-containing protein [Thalassovita sp.]|nr:c-type cytochrome domain-containing protein [Thalassovita sp.]
MAGDAPAPGWDEVSAIFKKRCINCHSEHGASKGLRLDSYEAVLAGGDDGAVVVAGDAAVSEMIRRLRGESVPRMPFLDRPLSQDEVDVILRWIEAGAPRS